MKTFFLNKQGFYFIINVPIKVSLLKGGLFATRESMYNKVCQLTKCVPDEIYKTAIVIYREADRTYYRNNHTVTPIHQSIESFVNNYSE